MILVTGATGLSGSIVIREFARQTTPVRALVRTRAKSRALETLPTVALVEGDMLRPETLAAALHSVDRVLMISSSDPRMVETQCTFIDACKKAGIKHVVKFSGAESGIGFDPGKFRFVRMHEEIDRYLERSGLAWTHLRPSQFMQVYLREAPTIVAENVLYLPMDNARLSPVDIEDIARVALRLVSLAAIAVPRMPSIMAVKVFLVKPSIRSGRLESTYTTLIDQECVLLESSGPASEAHLGELGWSRDGMLTEPDTPADGHD